MALSQVSPADGATGRRSLKGILCITVTLGELQVKSNLHLVLTTDKSEARLVWADGDSVIFAPTTKLIPSTGVNGVIRPPAD